MTERNTRFGRLRPTMKTAFFSFGALIVLATYRPAIAAAQPPIMTESDRPMEHQLEVSREPEGGPIDDHSAPARVPKNPNIQVLFSGKQKQVAENWIYQGSEKPGGWVVEDGAMVTSKESLLSKKLYLDFQLHVEFKVPYMPEAHGQERGNSGVGLLATYEIQVLDSFGFKDPGSGDCGAVYSQAGPLVNACKPPRQWQTYDIVFHAARWENGVKVRNARVSVIQNGVCVQNNQEILRATGIASKETEGPGPIYLQYHNNTVRFRNVWVLPLAPEGATHYEPH